MSDGELAKPEVVQNKPQLQGKKQFSVLAIVLLIILGFAIAFVLYRQDRTNVQEAADPYRDNVSTAQAKEQSAAVATELKTNPPAATASTEERGDYYYTLLSTLQDDKEIIAAYEAAKSQNLSLPSDTLVNVARAYVQRGNEGDKTKALAILNDARQYVRVHGEDRDANGLTTGQLEWIEEQQKEMGL